MTIRRATSIERARAIAAIGTTFVLMGALQPTRGATQAGANGATQSSIPSDGGAVKAGDVIVWRVNKAITLQSASTTTSSAPAATPPAAAAAAPNAADVAAAAKALSQAAHDLLDAAGPPPDPSASGAQAFNAMVAATQKADAEMNRDVAAATAAGSAVVPTLAGTQQAASDFVDAAADNVSSAVSNADRMLAKAELLIATTALKKLSAAARAPTPAEASAQTLCFPYDSRFNVTSVVAATKNPIASGTSSATASNTQIVYGHFPKNFSYEIAHPFHFHALPGVTPPKRGDLTPQSPRQSSPCGATVPMPAYEETYAFTSDQLSENDFNRQGFTWGGLVIPYKYYFKDHSIKSNSSVVAFLGYEGWFPGMSLAGVVALGPGTAPTTSNASPAGGGSSASSSITAVTYTVALGLIASFGDSQTFKAGLMFGKDYQGNPSTFPYENKLWMALSIGAGF